MDKLCETQEEKKSVIHHDSITVCQVLRVPRVILSYHIGDLLAHLASLHRKWAPIPFVGFALRDVKPIYMNLFDLGVYVHCFHHGKLGECAERTDWTTYSAHDVRAGVGYTENEHTPCPAL